MYAAFHSLVLLNAIAGRLGSNNFTDLARALVSYDGATSCQKMTAPTRVHRFALQIENGRDVVPVHVMCVLQQSVY